MEPEGDFDSFEGVGHLRDPLLALVNKIGHFPGLQIAEQPPKQSPRAPKASIDGHIK